MTPGAWLVVLCIAVMVAYELAAAYTDRFATISELVWRVTVGWSPRRRRVWFLAMATGFVVLAGHFFFDWLR